MNKPTQAEEVYNAHRVGLMLNLGGAMLRRYAATYEDVSGSEIQIHKREGRLFNQEQVDTLLKARNLVTTQGLSVRAAIQIALDSGSDMALRGTVVASKVGVKAGDYPNTQAQQEEFAALLRNAVQHGNKELLEEMRLLRSSLESNSNLIHNSDVSESSGEPVKHGLFVKFAIWVESFLKKGNPS